MTAKESDRPPRTLIDFGPLLEPLKAHAEEKGKTLSEVVRSACAKEIGRKELLKEMRPAHRPKKLED